MSRSRSVGSDFFGASRLVTRRLVTELVVPGGGFKTPGYEVGSRQRAVFHLNFEPGERSQRLPRGLGSQGTPAKATDTAGHFAPPLVTDTVRSARHHQP